MWRLVLEKICFGWIGLKHVQPELQKVILEPKPGLLEVITFSTPLCGIRSWILTMESLEFFANSVDKT